MDRFIKILFYIIAVSLFVFTSKSYAIEGGKNTIGISIRSGIFIGIQKNMEENPILPLIETRQDAIGILHSISDKLFLECEYQKKSFTIGQLETQYLSILIAQQSIFKFDQLSLSLLHKYYKYFYLTCGGDLYNVNENLIGITEEGKRFLKLDKNSNTNRALGLHCGIAFAYPYTLNNFKIEVVVALDHYFIPNQLIGIYKDFSLKYGAHAALGVNFLYSY